jgi:dihydrofolate synthase / folylpolyglutamate synthase
MDTRKIITERDSVTPAKQRNYQEIVTYLNEHWHTGDKESSIKRMEMLDRELGSVAQKKDAVIVCGTNGKSLTIHFASRLLQAEGLNVGILYAPHILTYNERIATNSGIIPNKSFTDIGNVVIDAAERLKLTINSSEILSMMAFLFFKENNVDVMLLEAHEGGAHNPVNICHAKVVAITRITGDKATASEAELTEVLRECAGVIKKGTHVVAGDQIKNQLRLIEEISGKSGAFWAMPIRKLAPLAYPFEQLHGRCAALAERISSLYINNFVTPQTTVVSDSLLVKQKGRRGRPTLEAKKQASLNPKKTVDQFWKENVNELSGRFQLLDKENPSILLDSADNLDALENTLLGLRLLHYQRPTEGLAIVMGARKDAFDNEEFSKMLRYFLKKTPGRVFICPIDHAELPGCGKGDSWNVDLIATELKVRKIKAEAHTSFDAAFEAAKKSVDERNGLVAVLGSHAVINSYWHLRGVKKLG